MPAPEALARACRRVIRTAQAERRVPSVTGAVARGGELVWAESVGLADLGRGEEATPDHQHRVASITKTFTAVAVMQLRDAGRLDLGDPLDKHVEGAGHAPVLRRLLSHLSGLQREPVGADWEALTMPTAEEVVERLGEAEQVLAPGDAWHYSNLAFDLLGEVVTRISGQPYERYVEERILAPVGLERTTWERVQPAATGYFVQPYTGVAEKQPIFGGPNASGGLWSTVGDLCRWAAFMCEPDPEVLAPDTVEEMHRLQAMADLEHWTLGWGLGLMLFRRGEHLAAGHSGGHAGFLSNLAWHRESKTGAAVLTNSGAGIPIQEVGTELLVDAVEALPPEPDPWRPEEAPPQELAGALGPWWSEGAEFVLRWRGGRLEADAPGGRGAPAVFEREAEDRYRTVSGRERGELLELIRDEQGAVVKLTWATYPLTREPRAF